MVGVLILGGVGFIGRNLVQHLLLCQDDAARPGAADGDDLLWIRVVDKTMPALAYLDDKQKAAFNDPRVQFVQADLTKEDHVAKAFRLSEQDEEQRRSFTYVVNLCGETKFAMSEVEYETKIVGTAARCVKAAIDSNSVAKWIEVSTACVYAQDKNKPVKEGGKLAPWTVQGVYRLKSEEIVQAQDKMPYVILRPSMVYGPGDLTSMTPRLCTAAVYFNLDEKMKCLWSKDLSINVVHVVDVCQAIMTSFRQISSGTIVNLSDKSELTQGGLNEILSQMFNIRTGFQGVILSNLAKLNISAAAEMANQKHVPAWQKLCTASSILNTPISPYLDATLLGNNSLSIDGSYIEEISDFRYSRPQITTELLMQQLEGFIKLRQFPDLFNQ